MYENGRLKYCFFFCNNLSVVTAGVIFYPYAFTESFINLKTYCVRMTSVAFIAVSFA